MQSHRPCRPSFWRAVRPSLLFGAAWAAAGCTVTGSVSPSDQFPVGDAGAITAIRLEPAEATLRIVGDTRARQTYAVFATFPGGREVELAPSQATVTFRVLDTSLGTFEGREFVSYTNNGGRTRVEARLGALTAQADLTLALTRSDPLAPVGGGAPLPLDPRAVFDRAAAGGVDPTRAPALVYPNAGVILPPNLGTIEVHALSGGDDNTLFELAFLNDVTDVRFYGRCERPAGVGQAGQCLWTLEGDRWRALAETNRGRSEPLVLRVRATDDEGTALGLSDEIGLRFALDDLRGTLYYWTTSDLPPPLDGPSVLRFDFGDPNAEPEPMITESQAGRCVGCHALSRDGTKLLASVGGQWSGGVMLRDLEVGLGEPGDFLWRAPNDQILQFAAFSPDGSEFVGVYGERDVHEDPPGAGNGGDLIVFRTECDDVPDGCRAGRIDLGGAEASHPDWSADGRLIAFTDVGINNTSQRPLHSGISYVVRDGEGWTAPVARIPRVEGRNRYNPSLAPGDAAVFVFNESVCPGGDLRSRACNADTDPSAAIWAAVTQGDSAPVLLAAAGAPGALDAGAALANTFPKFAPFTFLLEQGEFGTRRILWLTFSSTRRYGIRRPVAVRTDETDSGTLLWMVAVEPERIARGEDPSAAAFALPFQDLDTSNHIGVWTERAVGEPILR